MVADMSAPLGRSRLRQGHPVTVGAQPDVPDAGRVRRPEFTYAAWRPGPGRGDLAGRHRTGSGGHRRPGDGHGRSLAPVPVLKLITGYSVHHHDVRRRPGAVIELVLHDVPTVCRTQQVHVLRRALVDHQPGMNGLSLDGTRSRGEPLSDSDTIRWGTSRTPAVPGRDRLRAPVRQFHPDVVRLNGPPAGALSYGVAADGDGPLFLSSAARGEWMNSADEIAWLDRCT